MRKFGKLLKDEKAATAVEYGLILALIVLSMLSALSLFATATTDMWDNVANKVTSA